MEQEMKELVELREKYQRLVDITNEDNFKEFQKYVLDEITEGLKNEFVTTYHNTTDDRRRAIDNQAIFVSGFNNLISGIQGTVAQCDIEMERLQEDMDAEASNEEVA